MLKKLSYEEIHPDTLHEFVACRLIPLDKGEDKWSNIGVRPIGIGEIFRRLVGKVVVENIRTDIIDAAGPLQTCVGLDAGIEASIHAMKSIFDEESTEAILLVDAENAFNNLNRKAAQHKAALSQFLTPTSFIVLSPVYFTCIEGSHESNF